MPRRLSILTLPLVYITLRFKERLRLTASRPPQPQRILFRQTRPSSDSRRKTSKSRCSNNNSGRSKRRWPRCWIAVTAAVGAQRPRVLASPAPALPTASALTAVARPARLRCPARPTSLPRCWNRRHSAAQSNGSAMLNEEGTAGRPTTDRSSWLHSWQP